MKINEQIYVNSIVIALRDYFNSNNKKKLVIGVSGGLDSALAAKFSCLAVGADNVIGVIMPTDISNKETMERARRLVKFLGINSLEVNIDEFVSPLFDRLNSELFDEKTSNDEFYNKIRFGNLAARTRMLILYHVAHLKQGLVVGTGNKSETLLGYTTLWGDMCCDINPLSHLYKTQVREIARYLNLPQEILEAAPSADLFAGQTDEGEMGITYKDADVVMELIFDQKIDLSVIKEIIDTPEVVDQVLYLNINSKHKRRADKGVFSFPQSETS
jgi:NAD+ synthase